MNVVRFIGNFIEVAKKLKDSNFTGSELAKLSLDASVKLEELEYKDRELSLNVEKTRQEIELATLKAKSEVAFTMSEALKSIVQAECMILGVRDNANINKCNALVAYMNTLGNASNVSSLTQSLQTEILLTIRFVGVDSLESMRDFCESCANPQPTNATKSTNANFFIFRSLFIR